jgi:hypothetical protein
VIGAIMGREGRHAVLRLGLRDRWRQHFALLLERIAALAISTVAQFTDNLKTLGSGGGNRVPQPGHSALAWVLN